MLLDPSFYDGKRVMHYFYSGAARVLPTCMYGVSPTGQGRKRGQGRYDLESDKKVTDEGLCRSLI